MSDTKINYGEGGFEPQVIYDDGAFSPKVVYDSGRYFQPELIRLAEEDPLNIYRQVFNAADETEPCWFFVYELVVTGGHAVRRLHTVYGRVGSAECLC